MSKRVKISNKLIVYKFTFLLVMLVFLLKLYYNVVKSGCKWSKVVGNIHEFAFWREW